jgi:hypothetical protein
MAKQNRTPIDMMAETLTFDFEQVLPQFDNVNNLINQYQRRQNKFGLARRKDRQARQDELRISLAQRQAEAAMEAQTRKIELMANMHIKMQELELARAESEVRMDASKSAKKASDLAARETEARLTEFEGTKEHRAKMRKTELQKAQLEVQVDQARLLEIADARKLHKANRAKIYYDMVQGGIKTLRDGFVSMAQVAESQQNIKESEVRQKAEEFKLKVAKDMQARTDEVTARIESYKLSPDQREIVYKRFIEENIPIEQGVKDVARQNEGLYTNQESRQLVDRTAMEARGQTTQTNPDGSKVMVTGDVDRRTFKDLISPHFSALTPEAQVRAREIAFGQSHPGLSRNTAQSTQQPVVTNPNNPLAPKQFNSMFEQVSAMQGESTNPGYKPPNFFDIMNSFLETPPYNAPQDNPVGPQLTELMKEIG